MIQSGLKDSRDRIGVTGKVAVGKNSITLGKQTAVAKTRFAAPIVGHHAMLSAILLPARDLDPLEDSDRTELHFGTASTHFAVRTNLGSSSKGIVIWNPEWHPTGWIAFTDDTRWNNLEDELAFIRPDGSDLTYSAGSDVDSTTTGEGPSFDPSGHYVAFSGSSVHDHKLVIFENVFGEWSARSISLPGRNGVTLRAKRWSPDGKWIVYKLVNDDGHFVVQARPDGSEQQILMEGRAHGIVISSRGEQVWLARANQILRIPINGAREPVVVAETEHRVDLDGWCDSER